MQIFPPINTNNNNNDKRRGRRMVVPLLLLGYSLLSANLTAGHNIPVDGSPPIDGSSDDSTASMDEVRLPGDRDKRELPSSTPRASAELMGIHEEDIRLKRDEDDDTPLHEDYEAEKSDVAMAQMIEAAAALNGTLANEEHQHHHDDHENEHEHSNNVDSDSEHLQTATHIETSCEEHHQHDDERNHTHHHHHHHDDEHHDDQQHQNNDEDDEHEHNSTATTESGEEHQDQQMIGTDVPTTEHDDALDGDGVEHHQHQHDHHNASSSSSTTSSPLEKERRRKRRQTVDEENAEPKEPFGGGNEDQIEKKEAGQTSGQGHSTTVPESAGQMGRLVRAIGIGHRARSQSVQKSQQQAGRGPKSDGTD